MKEWSHDELHRLIDSDPGLKAKSNKVHSMPPAASLDEWAEQKRQMMQIYTEAVACARFDNAINFLEIVLGYIKVRCSDLDDWKDIVAFPEHRQALQTFGETFKAQKRCYSPGGNDYVCFCNSTPS